MLKFGKKIKRKYPPDCKLLATFQAKGMEWDFIERNDGKGDYFLVYKKDKIEPSFVYSFDYLNGFCDEKKLNFIKRMEEEKQFPPEWAGGSGDE